MDDDGTDDFAEEDLKMDMDIDTWNEPGAFEKFILDVIPPLNYDQVYTAFVSNAQPLIIHFSPKNRP